MIRDGPEVWVCRSTGLNILVYYYVSKGHEIVVVVVVAVVVLRIGVTNTHCTGFPDTPFVSFCLTNNSTELQELQQPTTASNTD